MWYFLFFSKIGHPLERQALSKSDNCVTDEAGGRKTKTRTLFMNSKTLIKNVEVQMYRNIDDEFKKRFSFDLPLLPVSFTLNTIIDGCNPQNIFYLFQTEKNSFKWQIEHENRFRLMYTNVLDDLLNPKCRFNFKHRKRFLMISLKLRSTFPHKPALKKAKSLQVTGVIT